MKLSDNITLQNLSKELHEKRDAEFEKNKPSAEQLEKMRNHPDQRYHDSCEGSR